MKKSNKSTNLGRIFPQTLKLKKECRLLQPLKMDVLICITIQRQRISGTKILLQSAICIHLSTRSFTLGLLKIMWFISRWILHTVCTVLCGFCTIFVQRIQKYVYSGKNTKSYFFYLTHDSILRILMS